VAQLLGLADAVHDGLTGLAFLAAAGAHPTKDEVADHLRGYVAEPRRAQSVVGAGNSGLQISCELAVV
jgi:hypothetical protein